MRLHSPLKPIGKHTAKWKRWRDKNYGLLALRCKGVCEGCGSRTKLDVHHVIGRTDEPFSSHVSLLAGLCRACHEMVTGQIGTGINLAVKLPVDYAASMRFSEIFGFGYSEIWLHGREWEYDSASNKIVRKS